MYNNEDKQNDQTVATVLRPSTAENKPGLKLKSNTYAHYYSYSAFVCRLMCVHEYVCVCMYMCIHKL